MLDFIKRNTVNGAMLAGAGFCVYAPPAALVNLISVLAATPALTVFGALAPYVAIGLIAAVSIGVIWGVTSAIADLVKDLVHGIQTSVIMLVSMVAHGLWSGSVWLLGKICRCEPAVTQDEYNSDNSSTTVALTGLGGPITNNQVNHSVVAELYHQDKRNYSYVRSPINASNQDPEPSHSSYVHYL